MTPSLKSVQAPDNPYSISLAKLTGLPIKDIYGYISCEFGEPVFKISQIVLEGYEAPIWVEGEHDFPYICEELPGAPEATLRALYEESNR